MVGVDPEPVLLETCLRDGLVLLTLNRPTKRNAFNATLYNALSDALDSHANSIDTRILVLAGKGPSFSSGMDLKDVSANQNRVARRFMLALIHCPLPVVVAVHGQCVGIGTTLLMHADVVFCADDSEFTTPFRSIGIPPEFASSLLFPARLGQRLAARMLYNGDTATAKDFRAAGVAEDEECGGGAKGVCDKAVAYARNLSRSAAPDDEWQGVLAAKEMIRSRTRGAVLRAVRDEFEEIDRAYRIGRPQRLIAARIAALEKKRSKL